MSTVVFDFHIVSGCGPGHSTLDRSPDVDSFVTPFAAYGVTRTRGRAAPCPWLRRITISDTIQGPSTSSGFALAMHTGRAGRGTGGSGAGWRAGRLDGQPASLGYSRYLGNHLQLGLAGYSQISEKPTIAMSKNGGMG